MLQCNTHNAFSASYCIFALNRKDTLIKTNSPARIILGVDPGTIQTGYGIIRTGSSIPEVLAIGTIQLGRQQTDNPTKLKKIFERLSGLIAEFGVQELSIEAPFFGKNIQSMLKLGRAQGVAMAAAMAHHVEIYEYAPRKIKQAITGNGNAGKEQVHKMLESILKIKIDVQFMDASDGLAAAMCHWYQKGNVTTGSGGKKKTPAKTSWAAFLKDNPDKLLP